MADISATIKKKAQGFEFQSATEERAYVLDVAAEGVLTVATHNILPIGAGEVCFGGFIFVEDAVTSSGSGTVQIKIGADTLTGAIPVANLAVGDVVKFGDTAATATTTFAGYAKSAADTLDMAVGTAALLVGKVVIVAYFMSADAVSALVD